MATTIQNNSVGNLSNMTGLDEAELAKRAEQMVDVKTGKISALSALDAALVEAQLGTSGANMDAFTAAGSASVNPHAIDDPTQAFTANQAMGGFAPEAPPPPSIGGPQATLEKAAKSGGSKMSGFCGGGNYSPPPPPPAAAPPPPPPPAVTSPETPKAPPPVGAAPPSEDQPSTGSNSSDRGTPAPVVAQSTGTKRAMMNGFLDGAGGSPGLPSAGAPTASTAPAAGPSTADVDEASSDLDSDSTNIQFEVLKMQMQKMQQGQDALSNVISAMADEAKTAINNVKA
ncbi:MAG TPA: hypothetical protein VGO62_21090 [Myxococcota bacterium]|jgi:hypothetical protein